jgi:metallo-beta-lactamase class B
MRAIASISFLLFFTNGISGQRGDSSLKITPLRGDFYVFTTFNLYKGKLIPANGMYLVTNNGVVMFDTPWDTTQFQPLLDSIEKKHNKMVVLCIATHFHEDRTGGLDYYSQRRIKTYTTKKTDELSKERGMKRAELLMEHDTTFTMGQYSFQTYFPGPGHTNDNIVVWFEKEKILYGGCLIKSVDDKDLGNLSDANTKQYAATLRNVQARCNNPQFIIPGHGSWINTSSLNHTLQMARQFEKKD